MSHFTSTQNLRTLAMVAQALLVGNLIVGCGVDEKATFHSQASISELPSKMSAQQLSHAFWRGTLSFAEAQKLPTYLIDWNLQNQTHVRSTTNGARYYPSTRTIEMFGLNYKTAVRAGLGVKVPLPEMQPVEMTYNEAFHAWFHAHARRAPECRSLMESIQGEKQFVVPGAWYSLGRIPGVEELVEEALSELLSSLINDLRSQRKGSESRDVTLASYDEAKGRNLELTPSHNSPGDKWHKPEVLAKAANRPISRRLYNAFIEVLQHGCTNS